MKIQVTSVAEASRASLVAVLLPEGAAPALDTSAGTVAAALLRRKEWTPSFRETLLVYGDEGKDRLLLVGLGKEKEVDAEKLRRAAALVLARVKGMKVRTLGIRLETAAVPPAEAGGAIAEGLRLRAYQAPAARKTKPDDPYRGISVRIAADRQRPAFQGGVERGVVVAEATNLARELGDLPGNVLTPTRFADRSARLARDAGLKARVYRKKDLDRLKMGGILAVNQGSVEPPVLIELSYRPRRFRRTVCLVGKGLTFDTGGISLKPAAGMEEMKYDMCGGAAVVATMVAVARLKPAVQVIGIVPSTDNMPGSSAQKPGDTLTTASGLTVEVINTDAEGRLILSDGLHHATTFEPDYIVDLATLTGACVIALGHDVAALYGNHEGLSQALCQAGEQTGDLVWPMPTFPEYEEDLKSNVADMKNVAGRDAGAGTAAWFLSRFVAGRPWAHLDIAGTAWGQRDRDYLTGKGATGAGVRLLVRWLESLA